MHRWEKSVLLMKTTRCFRDRERKKCLSLSLSVPCWSLADVRIKDEEDILLSLISLHFYWRAVGWADRTPSQFICCLFQRFLPCQFFLHQQCNWSVFSPFSSVGKRSTQCFVLSLRSVRSLLCLFSDPFRSNGAFPNRSDRWRTTATFTGRRSSTRATILRWVSSSQTRRFPERRYSSWQTRLSEWRNSPW